jgi:hypothetical protein
MYCSNLLLAEGWSERIGVVLCNLLGLALKLGIQASGIL